MNDNAVRPPSPLSNESGDNANPRLSAYLARTERPLDLLALATLWIVVVPPGDFGTDHHAREIALLVRVAASLIYAVDVTIRARLAHRHVNYLVTHPVAIASVVFPPVRVLFSLRLIRRVFRRGNLALFLFAATVLVLNGSIVVYFYERHAPHSNIHSLGDAVWWAFVTVTTVGYGDFYPVTPQGRITACVIMGIGIMTLAVVTAQVASSFVSQGSRSALDPAVIAPASTQGLASPDPSLQSKLTDLDRRLARIEDLIVGMSGRPHST